MRRTKRYRQAAAFILAGGASSRMGRNKGLLNLGGVPLIVHTARLVEPLVSSVTVVTSQRRHGALGLREITDRYAGKQGAGDRGGPLAGLATALAATISPWNLILACDLPYLSEAWLDWLVSRALRSHAQIILPRTPSGFEPLAAVYHRDCRATIAAAFARGVRKVTDALDGLRLEILDQDEWRHVDPFGLVLTNMNTPQEYMEAVKRSGKIPNGKSGFKKKRQTRPRP